MKAFRFHRLARQEILRAAEHYAAIQPDLGRRFYDSVEQLICDVRRRPAAFRLFAPPAHRHFGGRFPYAIVYIDLPDHVWIVAVMHFRQRPDYWVERVT